MSEKINKSLGELKLQMPGAASEAVTGIDGIITIYVEAAKIVEVLEFLKNDPDANFDMLTDETAVDLLNQPVKTSRFEVIYHLVSTEFNHRLRIKVKVAEEKASLPTATTVYPGASWLEREIWDMFGISFEGHPDLRRILMWEGFEGNPLRKDFPLRGLNPIERTPES